MEAVQTKYIQSWGEMVNAAFLVISIILIIANADSHKFPMGYKVQRTWGTGRKRVYTTFNIKVTLNLSFQFIITYDLLDKTIKDYEKISRI